MKDAFAIASNDKKDEPKVSDCRPSFSFFFDLIRKECNGLSPAPLHRICTLMRKMGVQCFVREELTPNAEILEEQTAAAARTGGAVTVKAIRLTFFRELPSTDDWRALAGKEILGYAVLLAMGLPDGTTRHFILESVIRIPSLWIPDGAGGNLVRNVTNSYVHCCREFETVIGSQNEAIPFRLTGSFFCQQNDLTHVCAHAALRMGINSSAAFNGAKLTNSRINQLLGLDHSTGKRVGKFGVDKSSVGLGTEQIVEVVKQMGWQAHVADFVSNPAIDYEDFIYPLVESGCPTILGIHNPNTAHVLAVLGHTLNSDRWTPEARHGYGAFPISPYISTSAWADHFIVSDDNFGMYVTLPTDSIRNVLVPKHNPNLHAALAIGLAPDNVNVTGYFVEQRAASLATQLISLTNPTSANRWFGLLKETGQKLVCRTLLSSKSAYVDAMKSIEDDQHRKITATEVNLLESSLPERFWVTEVTVPNLYSGNKRKLGDVITLSTVTQQQFVSGAIFPLCWLPGTVWTASAANHWPLFGHVPLLRGASETGRTLEW